MKLQVYVPMQGAPQGSKVAFHGKGRDHNGDKKIIMRESSKKVKPFREAVKLAAKTSGATPQYGPISLTLIFIRPAKANAPKTYTPFVTTLPDLDKQIRAVCDGLTGVAYRDDGQVCHINAAEMYPNDDFPKVGVYIVIRAGKDIPKWLGQWPRGKEPDF